MFKILTHQSFTILLIAMLSSISAVATPTNTQIHAVLSVITSFILSSTPKEIALKKVAEYADSNGTTATLVLADYEDIGITNMESRILAPLNSAIALLTSSQVDTTAEIQALVDDLLNGIPVITLIGDSVIRLGLNSQYIENNATVQDSIEGDISQDINITGTVDTSTEGNYTIRYNAKDEDNHSAIEVTREVRINANPDTSTPIFDGSSADYNVSVDENQLFAIDLNASDDYTIHYSISEGNSSLFVINPATGVVTFITAPDYESGNIVYTFTASASDGEHNTTQSVTININNIYDVPAPVFDSSLNFSVSVNEGNKSVITLLASDTETYSITQGDSALFDINATTGVVTFKSFPDFEILPNTYSFLATASNAGGNVSQTVNVTILNVDDESPVFVEDDNSTQVSEYNVTVLEENTTALTLYALDIDSNRSTIVFSIEDGLDKASFDINSSSGVITFKVAPDYESGKILYTFEAKAQDENANESFIDVTINIANIFEQLPKKTGQTISYDESGDIIDINDTSDASALRDDGLYEMGQIYEYSYSRNPIGIVTDTITELDWQDDVNTSKPWITQANWDTNTPESLVDTSGDTATTYCATLGLGGHSNWRLPSLLELDSLVEYHHPNGIATINPIFVNTVTTGSYWSATMDVDPNTLNRTWQLRFDSAKDSRRARNANNNVRCVRTK